MMPGRPVREMRLVYEMREIPDDPKALLDSLLDLRRQVEMDHHKVQGWEMNPDVHHALVHHLLNSSHYHELDTFLGVPIKEVYRGEPKVVAVVQDERFNMEGA